MFMGKFNDKLGDVVPVDAIGPHHLWGFGNACELWTEALKTAVGRWVCVSLHKTWADSKHDDHGLVSSIISLVIHGYSCILTYSLQVRDATGWQPCKMKLFPGVCWSSEQHILVFQDVRFCQACPRLWRWRPRFQAVDGVYLKLCIAGLFWHLWRAWVISSAFNHWCFSMFFPSTLYEISAGVPRFAARKFGPFGGQGLEVAKGKSLTELISSKFGGPHLGTSWVGMFTPSIPMVPRFHGCVPHMVPSRAPGEDVPQFCLGSLSKPPPGSGTDHHHVMICNCI